jgi:hypothetical protein
MGQNTAGCFHFDLVPLWWTVIYLIVTKVDNYGTYKKATLQPIFISV